MNPVYVFLDFDGVTHPWGEVEDFRCLPMLEDVLRDYPETRVVISSDWRTLFSLQKLSARFAEDIRARVVDCSPTIFPRTPNELYGLREREARQQSPECRAAMGAEDASPSQPVVLDSPFRPVTAG